MTTNFFQNIASLNLQGVWKLAITTDDKGNFIVSQLFNTTCGDKAVNLIVPLTLSGTAEDLDEGFFDKVTEPTLKNAGLQTNMEAHLKSVEVAKAASKLEQDKKNKEKTQTTATATKKTDDVELPEPKISKEDKKKAYDEAMEKVTELIKKLKFSEALTILPTIEDHPNKENELKKKRQYLEQQANLYEKALINFNA
ncbi:PRTRC system protein E [Mucilaginibacter sp. ZT4R22]|uniref:PRTRC system protein E n=1 Tax=Mucilaginibacter pankratovii TaxID=2772110 RepID=A0ABR7WMI6_9SPHI|nr:PRTRC system protein E [Mucilaginibacter pankratovii]MBD1362584.1 PRTRC system protein E [Mucilaginibacter pankratovii]